MECRYDMVQYDMIWNTSLQWLKQSRNQEFEPSKFLNVIKNYRHFCFNWSVLTCLNSNEGVYRSWIEWDWTLLSLTKNLEMSIKRGIVSMKMINMTNISQCIILRLSVRLPYHVLTFITWNLCHGSQYIKSLKVPHSWKLVVNAFDM